MADRPQPDALIDGLAPLLGLEITPEQRPGVIRFLAVAADMAALLDAAPVAPDHLARASVFVPVVPAGRT